ncbi:MAG: biopolymer transporter ExbD [Bacteroidales bacterium]|jgi:biopolymer transport protein ExbD|nr:biopolymer transporter ExbD [Bacteroidales bacterium]MDD3700818.1 biopolymer transporter ExbD [Bacteroidales bacterium]MDY0369403.1 biopolymer transporter ExbD [Bacteroidales bacterium]
MAIQTRNKLNVGFSMASMSDVVFLLLIFFMLTSTLIAPNAIKLLLPSSNSKTMAKQTFTVYINDQYQYFVEESAVEELQLVAALMTKLQHEDEATVVLRADKTVPVQYIVTVIDAINEVNQKTDKKHKVILATSPKK